MERLLACFNNVGTSPSSEINQGDWVNIGELNASIYELARAIDSSYLQNRLSNRRGLVLGAISGNPGFYIVMIGNTAFVYHKSEITVS